ncbi:MAG: pyridoxal 5'-phosphate synthase [Actinobacteria bacterium]|nr:pyridoxal 5'-phosphate synthase [Actinomycetota bacterium]
MTDQPPTLRDLLRGLPVLTGAAEEWVDPETLPAHPLLAVRAWLLEAVAAGEPEPHAMTLSTVSAAGQPSSRVLLCKDIDEQALYYATPSHSRKAREVTATGVAAAHFYWKSQVRQACVSGTVERLPEPVAAADFAARGRASQLAALVHADGEPAGPRQVRELRDEWDARLPGQVPPPPFWGVYGLRPREVELWQGRRDRLHFRVRYRPGPDGWTRELLWP